jgi:tetratricopeptide (TPR) repeat protein
MTLEAARLRERIAQAERDLAEIDEQVAEGEMDGDTASRLRSRYEAERSEMLELLNEGAEKAEPAPATRGLVTPRRLAGAAILTIAAAVLAFGVVQAVGDSAAEGVALEVVSGSGVNLDNVTNEQMEEVVAQNPDIAPMRLALADRYFADGEFSSALNHYMYVLDTLEVQDASALANVGWMTHLSGASDIAVSFVERSLEVQPDGGVAFWYLANIRFRGLGDAAGAIEPLQKLLEYDNLPADLRSEAEDLLTEVEAS